MKCTGRNCPMQYGTVDPVHCLAADECLYVTKPLTNADRIRAMTDEELAEWINRMEPTTCHDGWDYMIGCGEDKDCVNCWLDWLKQEVEDGN